MIRNSIFFKITLLFLFSLISFSAFSFYFIQYQKENEVETAALRYEQITIAINRIITPYSTFKSVENLLKELKFKVTKNKKIKEALINYNRLSMFFNGIVAKVVKDQETNKIYILLETKDRAVLYADDSTNHYRIFYFTTLIGIALLILVFILVIRGLLPLKTLTTQVKRFADGGIDVNCKTNQTDEIGQLSNEFHNTFAKLNAVQKSRSLFLRSIMHELKTPITKGRITTEMLENNLQKTRLVSVFKRLQNLIDEFAKIEQIASKNLNITKKEFLLEDLINHTKKMLLIDGLENDPIILDASNDVIKADFELFCHGD